MRNRFVSALCILLVVSPTFADEFYSPETATLAMLVGDYSPETATVPPPDPKYGPRWVNYDGQSVWDHLSEDHHAGKIIGDFRSLSHSQAVDLHSDLHNTGRTLNAADYGATVQTVQYVSAPQYAPELFAANLINDCPNGQCPVRLAPVRTVSRSVSQVATRTTTAVVSRSRNVAYRARNWRPLRRLAQRIRGRRARGVVSYRSS